MKKGNKSKYALEIQRIKDLSALNRVLKKGDVENALLSNATKDSETISDTVIDSMLEQVEGDKSNKRDIGVVERVTTASRSASARKRAGPKRSARPKAAKKKAQKGKKRGR